jgi:hypothetical protein
MFLSLIFSFFTLEIFVKSEKYVCVGDKMDNGGGMDIEGIRKE